MPSFELFEEQDDDYRESVLPSEIETRIAVEASSPFGWSQYTGLWGITIGMERFGASAPAGVLAEKFGFTPEYVASVVEEYLTDLMDYCGCEEGHDHDCCN